MGRGMAGMPAGHSTPSRAGRRGDLWSPGGVPGCWQQCAPHFLFGLAEKKTGRARSKRKERLAQNLRKRAGLLKTGVFRIGSA